MISFTKLNGKVIGVCVSLLLLVGCATLSKEECMTGNWETIGFGDGAAGYSGQRVSEHNKACAKVGIAPDFKAWQKGREQGLKQYCTETNAYQLGRYGKGLNPVCPSNIAVKLNQKNKEGMVYHTLTTQLKEEKKSLEKYDEQYDKLRNGDNLDFKTEVEARRYLVELTSKRSVSKKRIRELENDISRYQSTFGY